MRRRFSGVVVSAAATAVMVAAGCSSGSTPGLAEVDTTGSSTTVAPAGQAAPGPSTTATAGGSTTSRRPVAGQPGPVPSVAPGTALGPAAPLDQVVGVAADVLGPTTDVAAELERLGFFDPRVPIPPGELDVMAFSVRGSSGLGGIAGPTVMTSFYGRTPEPSATIDAFYRADTLAPEWKDIGQAKSGDNLISDFRLAATAAEVETLDLHYRLDADYSTPDLTVFLLSVDPVGQPDDSVTQRLAGWVPDIALPAGAELADATVSVLPTDRPDAPLNLIVTYEVAGADPATVAADLAASFGLTDWQPTERANGPVGERFELDPPPELTKLTVAVDGTQGGAKLTISGSREVPR